MAERYSTNNTPNEPEVNDCGREECEQVAFGFMTAKVGREKERSTTEEDKRLLDTFQIELATARRDSIHERNLNFPTTILSTQTPPDPLPPCPESPAAESVGIFLGQFGDMLEQHSTILTAHEVQSPVNTAAVPFYLAGSTQQQHNLHLSQMRERVEEAVNRIVPSSPSGPDGTEVNVSNSEQPVPPPPPLESSTFNSIARELIQVSDGNDLHPGKLAICLYFCYRLGVRMVTQHLANRLGLGNTLKELMETCVQFLIEQELLPLVQQQGGWGSYIDEWLHPSHQPMISSSGVGYVCLGLAVGFVLGFYVRAWRM